ncbi:MAG: ankyrin repeat domain-containing protein, partial [Gemmatimonadetes bacterium]|nr:ankyrin repeat domain-containing protein [Gemmatimonadota bacterium]
MTFRATWSTLSVAVVMALAATPAAVLGSGPADATASTVVGPVDAPVADAAERGDLEAVRALLRDGADVNASQGDGMSALHWAAMNGDADMI